MLLVAARTGDTLVWELKAYHEGAPPLNDQIPRRVECPHSGAFTCLHVWSPSHRFLRLFLHNTLSYSGVKCIIWLVLSLILLANNGEI